jgi:hypothetical protein
MKLFNNQEENMKKTFLTVFVIVFAATAMIISAGCSKTSPAGSPTPVPTAVNMSLMVTASAFNLLDATNGTSAGWANCTLGGGVTGASITANGAALTEMSAGFYQGKLSAALQAGETVTFEISSSAGPGHASDTVPTPPTVGSPANNATESRLGTIYYVWYVPPGLDSIEYIVENIDGATYPVDSVAATTTSSYNIPPATMPASTSYYYFYVNGTKIKQLTNHAPGSTLSLTIYGTPSYVNITN